MPGIDEKNDVWRVRQRSEDDFQENSFRTIDITDGVKAVIGKLKTNLTQETVMPKEEELIRENETLKTQYQEAEAAKTEAEAAKIKAEEDAKTATEAKEKAEKDLEDKKAEDAKTAELNADSSDMAWVDTQIEAKKVLPRDKKGMLFMLKNLRDKTDKMEFSEGDKKTEKTPLELYKADVEARGQALNTNPLGEGENREEVDQIEQLTLEYQEKHEGVSYSDASAKVLELHPVLNKGAE